MADEDLREEDVWGFVRERSEDSGPKVRKSKASSSSSASRAINVPRRGNNSRGSHEAEVAQQSSAPVNIPDWPKIYRKNSKKGSWVDDGDGDESNGCDHHHHHHVAQEDDDDDDDVDGDEAEMVPPHEYISRRLARSQISSSMCEGIGRTLKGRDLSKVRNAILTKTGFIE